MAQNTSIREAVNSISAQGILSEKNLEKKVINGNETIVGKLILKVDKESFVTFEVYSSRFTKSGAESKAYKAFETIMKEYVSIADCGDEEKADKVEILGKLQQNDFPNQEGTEMISTVRYGCNFASRVKKPESYQPRAEFTTEVFIQSIIDEQGKNEDDEIEPTGRKIMNVVIPAYNGRVIETKLIIPADEGAINFFESMDRNATVMVYANLVNSTIKKEAQQGAGGWGDKNSRPITKVVNEIVLKGAEDQYPEYDEDLGEGQKAYSPDLIRFALQERKNMLEEKLRNAESGSKPAKTGFGSTSTTTPSSVPSQGFSYDDMDDGELPF